MEKEVERETWYVIPRNEKEGATVMFSGTREACNQYVEMNWPSEIYGYDYLPGEGIVVRSVPGCLRSDAGR